MKLVGRTGIAATAATAIAGGISVTCSLLVGALSLVAIGGACLIFRARLDR